MVSALKPIETAYKGYRFRSRLEARWAVFFDALSVSWEYEKEGYDLGPAGWYLPDFWLPDLSAYFEVKAQWPNARESGLAQALANQSDQHVYIAVGEISSADEVLGIQRPWRHRILEFWPAQAMERYESPRDDACWWAQCQDCGVVEPGLWGYVNHHKEGCKATLRQQRGHVQLDWAITSARSARFEHGEVPKFYVPPNL